MVRQFKKKYIWLILRTAGIAVLSLMAFLLIVSLIISMPAVQTGLVKRIIAGIEKKTGTTLSVGRIAVILPDKININDLYVADIDGDTLLYSDKTEINYSLLELFKKKIQLNNLIISKAVVNLKKSAFDSTFNFHQYIEAFAANKSKEDPEVKDTTKKSFSVSVKRISLNNIRFSFHDFTEKNHYKVQLGKITVRFRNFSPESKLVDITSVEMGNTMGLAVINSESEKSSKPSNLRFRLRRGLSLKNVSLHYTSNVSHQDISIYNTNLKLTPSTIDLPGNSIVIDKLGITGTNLKIHKNRISDADSLSRQNSSGGNTAGSLQWKIALRELILQNNKFDYTDDNKPLHQSGIDFNRLQLENINADIANLHFISHRLMTDIRKLSFSESSGFVLDRLSASVRYSRSGAIIRNLNLQTPYTSIQSTAELGYNSIDDLQHHLQDVSVKVNITNSKVGAGDILYYVPQLASKNRIFSDPRRIFSLDCSLEGKVGNLMIDYLRAGFDSTVVRFGGTIKGLPAASSAFYSVKVDTLLTTGNTIRTILGDTVLPGPIHLPPKMKLTGKFNGTRHIFRASADFRSTFGNAITKVFLRADTSPGMLRFGVTANLSEFNAGKLLSVDSVGLVTLKVAADGTFPDFLPAEANARFSIYAPEINVSGYDYHNLDLTGKYKNHKSDVSISYKDINLILKLSASADFSDTLPAYQLNASIAGADLQALKLIRDNISIRGKLVAGFKGKNMNDLNGNAEFSDFLIVKNGKLYQLNSMTASVENNNSYTKVSLISQPLRLSYSGSVKISQLGHVMKDYLDHYFSAGNTVSPAINQSDNFIFSMELFNAELLSDVIWPDLKGILPATVKGKYNGAENLLNVDAEFPHIGYKNKNIDSLSIDIHSTDTSLLTCSLSLKHLTSPPLALEKTVIRGSAADNTISFSAETSNREKTGRYLVAGSISKRGQELVIHIDPDSLIINSSSFTMPQDNKVILSRHHAQFTNTELVSDDQRIDISQTADSSVTPAYRITFYDFEISSLTGLFESGRDIFSGRLNGSLVLINSKQDNSLSSDLILNDLTIYNDTAFTKIAVKAKMMEDGVLNLKSIFAGSKNNFTFSGTAGFRDQKNKLNLNAAIQNIDLGLIAPFIRNQFKVFDGDLSGMINIDGSLKAPDVNGELNLDSTTVTLSQLNVPLHFTSNKLKINNSKLFFNNFTIEDNLNNKATVNGKISFSGLAVPKLDINFRSTDFRFLNSTYRENNLYYGNMNANLDARISGTLIKPVIDMDAHVIKGSVFHLVVPALSTPSAEKEGIVRFVERNKIAGNQIIERSLENNVLPEKNTGNITINLTANVEIDEGTKIYILIDPSTNEELYVNGKANLSFSMKQGVTPNLTGQFLINDGTYSMTLFNVIRRTFTIKAGSNLQWTGNFVNPQTDITTIYEVHTSPLPLITDETVQLSDQDISRYSASMPFDVQLHISGHLLEPLLNFNLNAPQGQNDALVEAKLAMINSDETELNKQVFSLLLFNSFFQGSAGATNPVASELNATARSSVSRILTQQLNSIAERYIKGFNVNIAVNSYYQSAGKQPGGKTNVKLNISRELFNKRLHVQVGGDINVEGAQQKTPYDFNSLAGDVAIEYKLDEAGIYRLRGFSKSEYEDVIDGEVIATGISFIFNKDFYRLGNIFNKKDSTETNP